MSFEYHEMQENKIKEKRSLINHDNYSKTSASKVNLSSWHGIRDAIVFIKLPLDMAVQRKERN